MATKTIELTGILEWAKVFESNRDTGDYDQETDGSLTIDIILDDSNLKLMKDSGVRKEGKPDPDGRGVRVKFKRPWKDMYGRDWASGPIKVYTPSGEDWLDTDGLIGNGSVGVVFVDVYDTTKGVGSRLVGVQVIDHVVFDSDDSMSSPAIKPKVYTPSQTKAPTPTPTPNKAPPGDIPF